MFSITNENLYINAPNADAKGKITFTCKDDSTMEEFIDKLSDILEVIKVIIPEDRPLWQNLRVPPETFPHLALKSL